MRSPERPSKQEAFLALLREDWTSLHLDARRPGVVVPPHLRGEPHLVLQYGHDLPIPIPDLEVDEHGVVATLSFSQNPQRTVVPWSAVYVVACADGRGILYHEDVPDDVSVVAAGTPAEGGDAEHAGQQLMVGGVIAGAGQSAGGGAPGSQGPSGRISERLLRSVPEDIRAAGEGADDAGAGDELPQAGGARRRRKPQLRLVK
jgi:hypothetical protein